MMHFLLAMTMLWAFIPTTPDAFIERHVEACQNKYDTWSGKQSVEEMCYIRAYAAFGRTIRNKNYMQTCRKAEQKKNQFENQLTECRHQLDRALARNETFAHQRDRRIAKKKASWIGAGASLGALVTGLVIGLVASP